MESYAIVQTGGKQIRVVPSQVFEVERLSLGEKAKEVVLDQVLMVKEGKSLEVGAPFVKGASVVCEFLGQKQAPKVISFKIKRRKNYRKKIGHRQILTELRVKEIQFQE